jgi:hypothetical protein
MRQGKRFVGTASSPCPQPLRFTQRIDTGDDIMRKALKSESLVDEGHPVPLRISKIVDKLFEEDEDLRSLDKTQAMESLSNLMEDPPSDLTSITDDELTQRIERVLLIEAMSGILNDLSPEQMKAFEAAVKRRKFF